MIRLRLAAGLLFATVVATALTSCATGDGPTAPRANVTAPAHSANLTLPVVTPLLKGLLSCSPQPYASTQQWVGREGGTLHIGPHTLVIPPGALAAPVLIQGEAPSDTVVSVRFEPEGLKFLRPASLTLDYSSCPLGRLNILKHVAYTTNQLVILQLLFSQDNLLTMKVTAPLQHFSRYAVAW
ncbi:MAG TPA: hypothetical protein VMG41_12410 [Gemmatimonadales bacterium]|nr:hypothetical protein [Gemmatimonadales bacterium]